MLSPCDRTELLRSIFVLCGLAGASHSSLNLPQFCCATDCDSGEEVAGLLGVDPKSAAVLDNGRFVVGFSTWVCIGMVVEAMGAETERELLVDVKSMLLLLEAK